MLLIFLEASKDFNMLKPSTCTAVILLALSPVVVDAQRRLANTDKNKNGAGDTTWTTTDHCNCYEYLTDSFFRSSSYSFDQNFDQGHHKANNNDGYFKMAEFCCEFAAELVDPKCVKNENGHWVNGDGQPPHAPVESLVCDLFATADVVYKSELKQQARNACYCFYRDLGCGREELATGGYCDYPRSEVTLDDFRMANNSAHNMCNSCLERDTNWRYLYPEGHYEGQSHDQCLGYCLLKRGDPNDVYQPTVSDEQCCFANKGSGLELHGFDENHMQQEIIFMPFAKFEDQAHDYFFKNIDSESAVPMFEPSRTYEIILKYDGLCTAFMSVERYGTGGADYPPALYNISEFPIQCEPEDWDNLSVHVFDKSPDGGIVFKNVTMDGINLGDFGFGIQNDPSCSDTEISPDIDGIHGHNYTCITRPGGFGHISGFELKGLVELSGKFRDDDIGLELVVGCSQKEKTHVEPTCCCDGDHHHSHVAPVTAAKAKW